MGIFCLLWVPIFYVLRRLSSVGSGGGGIWPLIFGSVVVIVQFFTGPLVDPGGFGFYRWVSGFMDIVSMPVLVPLVLYLLFVEMNLISPKADHTSFTLLWLIPLAAFRSMDWLSPPSPVMLVLVPVLWTSLAVGMPALFNWAKKRRHWYSMAPFVLGMAVLPFAATTSWWAFFSHQETLGFLFLFVSILPSFVAVVWSFLSMISAGRQTVTIPEVAASHMETETSPGAEKDDWEDLPG